MGHVRHEELREAFAAAGYAEVAERLIAQSRRAVAIEREVTEDAEIPVGASKLGGWPDLPAGAAWPMRRKRALAFLGQFALADVPRAEGEPELPRAGLLSVFYDNVEQPWGFDPKDRGSWAVLHAPEATGLARVKPPKGAYSEDEEYDEPFKACRVRYDVVTTYPDEGNELYEREDAEALLEVYGETVKAGQGEEPPRHQLLGHPLIVQNPMEEECQLVSNGINCGGDLSKKAQAEAEKLLPGAKDWTLLMQLDTDDEAGWMWGDVGVLYFWIRREDLAAGDFGKVWCVLQCG